MLVVCWLLAVYAVSGWGASLAALHLLLHDRAGLDTLNVNLTLSSRVADQPVNTVNSVNQHLH